MKQNGFHKELERIVKKHIDNIDSLPEAVQTLLAEINSNYFHFTPDSPPSKNTGSNHSGNDNEENHDILFFIDSNDIITGYTGRKEDLFLAPDSFLHKEFSRLPLGEITYLFNREIKKTRETGSLNHLHYSGKTIRGRQYYDAQIIPSSEKGIIIIIRNVTKKVLQDNAIRDSEARFRGLAERSFDMVFLLERNGIFTYASPSSERIVGYPAHELVHNHFFSYIPSREYDHANSMITAILGGKNVEGFQTRFRRPDGSYASIEINASPIPEDNMITGIQGIARDISDHLGIQESLRKSEERFRSMIEYGTDVISIIGLDGIIHYESPSVERILGFRPENTIGTNAFEYVHPEDIPPTVQGFNTMLEKPNTPITMEFRLRHCDGTWKTVEATGINRLDHPSIRGMIINYSDITDQKESNESLRAGEERYRMLAENITDIIWVLEIPSMNTMYVSPSVTAMLGYEVEEALHLRPEQYLSPESYNLTIDVLSKEMNSLRDRSPVTERKLTKDVEYIRKDGSALWAEISVKLLPVEEGTPMRILGLTRDITERKKAEDRLKESEERMRILIETTKDIIYTLDITGNFNYISPRFEELTGHEKNELLGHHFTEFLPPEDIRPVTEIFNDGIQGKATTLYECIMRFPNGDTRPLELNVNTIYNSGGDVIGRLGVARDITQRKESEKALRESEKIYRLLTENSAELIWLSDLDLNFTYLSPSLEWVTGYKPEDLLGKSAFDILTPESALTAKHTLHKKLKSAPVTNNNYLVQATLELKQVNRDGSVIDVEINATLLRGNDLAPTGIRGVTRDITEKKRIERALRHNEEKYRAILETIQDGYFETDLVGDILYINDPYGNIIGYTNDELVGKNYSTLMDEENSRIVFAHFKRVYETEKPAYISLGKLIKKSGDEVYCECSVSLLKDDDNTTIGYCGIVRDITKRVENERALRESEQRYRLLAENSSDVIWTMDTNLDFTYISPSNLNLSGFSPEEIMLMGLDEIVHPDSLERANKYFTHEINSLKNGIDPDPRKKRILELQQYTKDGSLIDIEVNLSFLQDEKRKVYGILGISRDITARKKAERALRESEENLRQRNEIIEKDLKTAHLIQRSLVSNSITSAGNIQIDHRYLPLDAVGGDYYSFTELHEGGLGVFIGDVSSHGVTAALFLSLIKATTDRICRKHALNPEYYIKELNSELLGNMPLSFLTAIYGIFHSTGESGAVSFTFSCAGHPYPLLHSRKTGTVEFVKSRGTLIGMFDDVNIEKKTITMEKGDRLYLYTDGLPETMNSRGQIIEFDNLPDLIMKATHTSLPRTLDSIISNVKKFKGKTNFMDDIILIGFEIK